MHLQRWISSADDIAPDPNIVERNPKHDPTSMSDTIRRRQHRPTAPNAITTEPEWDDNGLYETCFDCGKHRFGKVYDGDGMFYCNECWMYYDENVDQRICEVDCHMTSNEIAIVTQHTEQAKATIRPLPSPQNRIIRPPSNTPFGYNITTQPQQTAANPNVESSPQNKPQDALDYSDGITTGSVDIEWNWDAQCIDCGKVNPAKIHNGNGWVRCNQCSRKYSDTHNESTDTKQSDQIDSYNTHRNHGSNSTSDRDTKLAHMQLRQQFLEKERQLIELRAQIEEAKNEKERFRLKAAKEKQKRLETEREHESFAWQWQDECDQWQSYDDETSQKIDALPLCGHYSFICQANKQTYQITKLKTDAGCQKNRYTSVTRHVRKCKLNDNHSDNINQYPFYWDKSYKNYTTPKVVNLTASSLSQHVQGALTPANTFYDTVDGGRSQYEIIKIEAIQNQMLYDKYCDEKRRMRKMVGAQKLNER
eukprot:534023_1